MASETYKKYTIQAKRCIRGESFFESIMSEFAIPHHIVGQKDLGIDYICEWVFGKKPSGVLFAIQIKTFSQTRPTFVGRCQLNQLDEYKISNSNLKISAKTLTYWQGLGMPIYLFAISDNKDGLRCYYKRYTAILTHDKIASSQVDYSDKFYKVSKSQRLIAFADNEKKAYGFARDLFVDYIRWNYFKGSITYLNPHSLGLHQFPTDNIFPELVDEYKDKIGLTYSKTKDFLERQFGDDFPKNSSEFSTQATASPTGIKISTVQ